MSPAVARAADPPAATVTVGAYLARRLREVGVEHFFGVPGDFNLTLLDTIAATGLLQWAGSPNELGAGYAADAYARRRGLGVLVTTYGVGELSCLNAVAGSAAESVPVLQITGAPATGVAAAGRLVHHTLADGVFTHFERAYAEVTVQQEVLTPERAGEQIDAVITAAMLAQQPAYLSIPADLASAPISAARLDTPLVVDPYALSDGEVDLETYAERAFIEAARQLLADAENPVIIVGHVAARFHLAAEITALAEAAGITIVAQPGAKGHVDERHPWYAGVYAGDMVDGRTAKIVAAADAVIHLGTVMTDVLSGFWTDRPVDAVTISLSAQEIQIAGGPAERLPFPRALRALRTAVTERPRQPSFDPAPPVDSSYPDPDTALTQATFWQSLQAWLPQRSALLADTGTAFWGALSLTLPPETELIAQPVWNSIGYSLPATLGAGLADPTRRPVLVIGDGAAQMTIQDLSPIAVHRLAPIVILLNNAGYTIERALQSPDAAYNDIAAWPWAQVVTALTAGRATTVTATDLPGLRTALEAATALSTMTFIEVIVDRDDVPPLLRALAVRNGGGK
jgi:TPP-dependent 2-oxoacid decarboxylase